MTLPWVSRGRYEDAIERLRIRDAEYGRLFDKYDALRLQGASAPEPKPVLARKEADPVMQAISQAAGNNGALRALMVTQAMQDRRMGKDDDDIIDNIERGVPDDFGALTSGD